MAQQNGAVREVSGDELLATYDDPFVRHQTDPAAVVRAFVRGPAAVIENLSHMPGAVGRLLMTRTTPPVPTLPVEELSAALTLRALDGGSGVATLGVYADNLPAVAVYRRLGYDVLHTFASGPIRD